MTKEKASHLAKNYEAATGENVEPYEYSGRGMCGDVTWAINVYKWDADLPMFDAQRCDGMGVDHIVIY